MKLLDELRARFRELGREIAGGMTDSGHSALTSGASALTEAAKTTPLSAAGPNPRRSTNCFLPPPTPSPQSFFTGSVDGNFTNLAGGSTSLSLLQPAAISSAASPTESNKRIRV